MQSLVPLPSRAPELNQRRSRTMRARKEVKVVRWSKSDGGLRLLVLVDCDFGLFKVGVTGEPPTGMQHEISRLQKGSYCAFVGVAAHPRTQILGLPQKRSSCLLSKAPWCGVRVHVSKFPRRGRLGLGRLGRGLDADEIRLR